MDLSKLKEPFDPKLISWRVGATNKEKTSCIALAYIDARDVMERLDEVCGIGNWQALHPHANGKTSCRIGIKIDGEWVWKENGCGDSDVEAAKGAFSDSLKRAAVLWGVGRYLYDVQNVWVDIVPYGRSYKIKNPNDSSLVGALEKAAKGIRVFGDSEPDTKGKADVGSDRLFQNRQDRLDWMKKAKSEIEALTDEKAVTAWMGENSAHINELGEKQQDAINQLAVAQKEKLVNA